MRKLLKRLPRFSGRWGRLVEMWAVGIAASLLVTGAAGLGYLQGLQGWALDLVQQVQGQQHPPGIVVVGITDEEFDNELGGRTPTSRAYLAKVVRGLQRAGARAVLLDFDFTSPTEPENDRQLAEAILAFSENGISKVVFTDGAVKGKGPLTDPRILAATVRGTPNQPVDPDQIVRHAALVAPSASDGSPQAVLSLALVARMAGYSNEQLQRAIDAGKIALPRWKDGTRLEAGNDEISLEFKRRDRIRFVGPANSFLTIPSAPIAALADPDVEPATDNPVRGRVVLVGGAFEASRDFFHTPKGRMYGVEVHATMVHMLLTRSFVRTAGWGTSLAVQGGIVLLAGVLLTTVRPLIGTLILFGSLILVGLPLSYLLFTRTGFWVDFFLPVLAASVIGIAADNMERRRFKRSFERYVSPEVANEILANSDKLAGTRAEVTMLISDLRNFTTMSEQMEPHQVAKHLNEYFESMTAAIFSHRGMVNDFVGDSIIAVFGAPVPDPDHAVHAVQSAVDMDRALAVLNERWAAAGLPVLRHGIGVHSGAVFAGNIGSAERLKYTVIVPSRASTGSACSARA
ncbi:MAG: adenylate/guanylate cyclase domain-containing protein [Candidatus Rokubacteria bacterium]|nr:adenylate/guanylate cyclase domain-containing protein [Candidatus Rokubacteria bacterium]